MADPAAARLALESLARTNGIDPAFEDIWGNRHEVSDHGLRALLGQLGVPADRDEDLPGSLARCLSRRWRSLAEPVLAVTVPAARFELAIRFPRPDGNVRLAWQFVSETGEVRHGDIDSSALPLLERAELEGVVYESRRLQLDLQLEPGYHRLHLRAAGTEAQVLVIAAPSRCFQPPVLSGEGRAWGWAVQLYGLRSPRNWGVGDFGDLLALIDLAASRGASAIGLSPLHARFPQNPAHASPYAPSSRLWLDVLAIDVESIDDFAEVPRLRRRVRSPAFRARLHALRKAPLVDYAGVSALKHQVLGELYLHFRHEHLARGTLRAAEFRRFQSAAGAPLRRHALYEVLQQRFHAEDPSIWGWPAWPDPWRGADPDTLRQFESQQVEPIEYHEYLQWQAEVQLARAASRCRERGMAIGLYMDLAVSVDRAGSDCWSFAHCYATSASAGAPPDEFNSMGQDWGLPPLIPEALRACGHEPFVLALRANMRHAGALRIDHVMGLMRLYWVPSDTGARDGGYVRYPYEELLAIVALESHRNRCLVIGEDLGTVPDVVRTALASAGVLSYRLLYFERSADGDFVPPHAWPRDALVSIGTHDLPTLAGWWTGHDLELRARLRLFPNEAMQAAQSSARAQDRERLVAALKREGLLSGDAVVETTSGCAPGPPLVDAVHAYLASAPAKLMMAQPEDWLGVVEQNNLPGTVDEHPNWRRKLPLTIDDLAADPAGERVARLLAEAGRDRRPHAPRARIPRSTCRLQLNRDFDFGDALRALPYLERLGIGDLYCSPVQRARPGSRHGYDVIDHQAINPELGGEAGFDALTSALHERGMGMLLDVVPNHMAVLTSDNAWWMDVLEHGPASAYARFFDIDWQPPNRALEGKVLVPILGDHYGLALERGELVLRFDAGRGSFAVDYHDHRLPVDPRETAAILRRALASSASGEAGAEVHKAIGTLVDGLARLVPREAPQAAQPGERAAAASRHRLRLARLLAEHGDLREAIENEVTALNGESPGARDSLHALMERQAWRLAYWRVAADEINYRRFFDINELAGLRVEDPDVFEATHALVIGLVASGRVDGLRIDHPDGLFDPGEYFGRLQAACARHTGASLQPDEGRPARPLYLVIEKIAAAHEHLPEHWPIHGTTGYRFAALANGVFVDRTAKDRLDRTWRAFTGEQASFDDSAAEGRQLVMRNALAPDLTTLAAELSRIAGADRRTRDYSFGTLRRALAEVAARMPVYRTYIADRASRQDRRYIQWAVGAAVRHSRAADTAIFGFMREVLLGRAPPGGASLRERTQRFARRFQQFTSPVMAKGVEDTALYRFNRLVSLNEVGGEPDAFGISTRAFHAANADRGAHWPNALLATSTHDNKRSADVRARIDVLSEMPAEWRLMLRRWRLMNRGRRTTSRGGRRAEGGPAPSRNDEYLLYQVLLGTFRPEDAAGDGLAAYTDRIERYMLKAAREAKLRTSWISPDADYEQALAGFVRAILAPGAANAFVADLHAQVEPVAWFGALNSLAMVVLAYTSPGVPDLYQGNELFDFSLVDPDNRRPVDFDSHAAMLDRIEQRVRDDGLEAAAAGLSRDPRADEAKLFVTWRLLQMRRAEPVLFRDGEYLPLQVTGAAAEHLIAYARRDRSTVLVVLVARLCAKLLSAPGRLPEGEAAWGDTIVAFGAVGAEEFVDQLSGRRVQVVNGEVGMASVFAGFPAAVLVGAVRPDR